MLSIFENELAKIDLTMSVERPSDIRSLFHHIPLDHFGKLLLDIPLNYPNIKAFFPTMATEDVQRAWTGNHGDALLNQSLAFIKTMMLGYWAITGQKLETSTVLDYGCGWGRLIRLLYKYISVENIYGVDPWDESIKICIQNGVKGNLAVSDYVPFSLPFERQFDLIFAFSVFTHLSVKTTHTVLSTLRKYISPQGVLVITIRPREYWSHPNNQAIAAAMLNDHDETGFAFTPHDRAPVNGDITYGDTSMTLDYLATKFSHWNVESVEWNEVDPYQVIVFLKPV